MRQIFYCRSFITNCDNLLFHSLIIIIVIEIWKLVTKCDNFLFQSARVKMLMAELFLEGWGGGTVQSALTWLAANLADSGRRGAVYHWKWGQGWWGACDVIFDCFSHWEFFFTADWEDDRLFFLSLQEMRETIENDVIGVSPSLAPLWMINRSPPTWVS